MEVVTSASVGSILPAETFRRDSEKGETGSRQNNGVANELGDSTESTPPQPTSLPTRKTAASISYYPASPNRCPPFTAESSAELSAIPVATTASTRYWQQRSPTRFASDTRGGYRHARGDDYGGTFGSCGGDTAPQTQLSSCGASRETDAAFAVPSDSALAAAVAAAAATMLALTVQGPSQALAMLIGKKLVENRSWSIKRGWYALHVGGKRNSDWGMRALKIDPSLPSEETLEPFFGCIIGLLLLGEQRSVAECGNHPWAFGPICHVVTSAVQFRRPLPCRGHAGLWPLPIDVRRQIQAELEDCPAIINHDLSPLGLQSQRLAASDRYAERKSTSEQCTDELIYRS
eukprot:TRINITY_DN54631_c0_g1_i1.p1 TRINITY_DN54631_c0_g1~~TRINITY_DN54631_c0_g1_i1.p1  ORF type:complete len:347 (+),score=40.68 TRINITY_DN54631_c0_g1_i1:105-1145(+)